MQRLTSRFGPYTIRYAIYGMIFGASFPVIATALEIIFQQLPLTIASIAHIHSTQPLHWIVDTAPIVLALMAALTGNRQDRLTRVNQDLEVRVAARTRDLEISINVGRQLSTILDQRDLVAEVVNQVQQAFNYYHVHIYLRDGSSQDWLMVGGTGEAGRAMLANGHKILQGIGLVGRAAAANEVILAPNVHEETGWRSNPLLPETRSEIAVPIGLGDQVLGVLDVQHNVVNGLTNDDARLLQSVANQVAIALRNAHLFEETRRRAERAARINAIGHEIQKAPDIETVLQTAVRELSQALDGPQITVMLDQDTLRKN